MASAGYVHVSFDPLDELISRAISRFFICVQKHSLCVWQIASPECISCFRQPTRPTAIGIRAVAVAPILSAHHRDPGYRKPYPPRVCVDEMKVGAASRKSVSAFHYNDGIHICCREHGRKFDDSTLQNLTITSLLTTQRPNTTTCYRVKIRTKPSRVHAIETSPQAPHSHPSPPPSFSNAQLHPPPPPIRPARQTETPPPHKPPPTHPPTPSKPPLPARPIVPTVPKPEDAVSR